MTYTQQIINKILQNKESVITRLRHLNIRTVLTNVYSFLEILTKLASLIITTVLQGRALNNLADNQQKFRNCVKFFVDFMVIFLFYKKNIYGFLEL